MLPRETRSRQQSPAAASACSRARKRLRQTVQHARPRAPHHHGHCHRFLGHRRSCRRLRTVPTVPVGPRGAHRTTPARLPTHRQRPGGGRGRRRRRCILRRIDGRPSPGRILSVLLLVRPARHTSAARPTRAAARTARRHPPPRPCSQACADRARPSPLRTQPARTAHLSRPLLRGRGDSARVLARRLLLRVAQGLRGLERGKPLSRVGARHARIIRWLRPAPVTSPRLCARRGAARARERSHATDVPRR